MESLSGKPERFRSRSYYLRRAPSHSWIHGGWFNRRDPQRTVYFLCTPHGPLTIHEEYFCWIYLVTGKYRMSKRMAYGRGDTNVLTNKLRERLKVLLEEHNMGLIDLRVGPWKHYGYQIGDPTAFHGRQVKDYMQSCLGI